MSKAEAIGVLARMAYMDGLSVEQVVALQVGVRSLCKRHFDSRRNMARRNAPKDVYRTPPDVSAALVNPPMEAKKGDEA
jgi:hypothetical protein